MRQEGALAAVTLASVLAVFTWRGCTWRNGGSSGGGGKRKRVSFSDAKNSFIEATTLDLTDEERRALNWSPAELRQFSRAVEIDGWLEEWGS